MNASGYIPHPIDTSTVMLGADLEALTERLAENAHELWAAERKSQGWTKGEKRDDVAKQHPCLVPYDELPEEEKRFDREAAMGTVRAILALGGSVDISAVPALHEGLAPEGWLGHIEKELAAATPGSGRGRDFDMEDGPEITVLRTAGATQAAEALQFLKTT
ncbi:MAG: hypothetical protein EOO61_22850, partial [Hymenobacter sp.]